MSVGPAQRGEAEVVKILLRDAMIFPGEEEPRPGDVAIDDGVIAAVGSNLQLAADRVIELRGLAVAPGFIDMHAHSALRPFRDPSLEPKVLQGFTTEVINPDGLGPAPVAADRLHERRAALSGVEGTDPEDWPWRSIEEYLDALEATGPATSLCPLVPHGAIRDFVMNGERREPTASELKAMRREVALGMEAGAWGLSFGLVYVPAVYSSTDELVALAEEAARYGGLLVPHVRGESHNLHQAIREMIGVARNSGAPLHISHLKVLGLRNRWRLEGLLELIDEAVEQGLDLTFDQYPYVAGATMLAALLPVWAQEGGTSETLRRLIDVSLRDRITRDMIEPGSSPENFYAHCGPESIVITDVGPAGPTDIVGSSIAEIAQRRDIEPTQALLDVLTETELLGSILLHYTDEATVRTIAQHPLMLVGTDAIFAAKPHPRLWGTAPRFLGRYAIRDGLMTVREAVARLSTRAARRIGLNDRGAIAEGLRADLVVFDPTTIVDEATFEDPSRPPSGVEWVIVGGEVTVDPDGLTQLRAGQVVRRG